MTCAISCSSHAVCASTELDSLDMCGLMGANNFPLSSESCCIALLAMVGCDCGRDSNGSGSLLLLGG
jgi:hypothetical protein